VLRDQGYRTPQEAVVWSNGEMMINRGKQKFAEEPAPLFLSAAFSLTNFTLIHPGV
jgi:hypothetical protein